MSDAGDSGRGLQLLAAAWSLGWLAAACAVGLLLAALLVFPRAGLLLGPLTYGRWMPLHMDWQLYGWCSLPLVGLLLRHFGGLTVREALLSFAVWSGALLALGVCCLGGDTSGKLFLNWAGPSRVLFPAALMFLWAQLATTTFIRWRDRPRARALLDAALLLVLLGAPVALWATAGRDTYPPIDPSSGGATGHSLLASTLGILGIFGVMPWMLGVRMRPGGRRAGRLYLWAWLASWSVWAIMGHGDRANTQPMQIAGLAVLLGWLPILRTFYLAHPWDKALRPWVWAFLGWWGFLALDGFITFLPGVLDTLKFTNALVAHAHLAMAGLVTAFNMLVLASLGRTLPGDPWTDRAGFALWQAGCLAYVLSMLVQGVREGLDPQVLFGADTGTRLLYAVRLAAGLLMFAASLRWFGLTVSARRTFTT